MAFAYSNLTHLITKKYLIDTQLLSTKLYLENGWKTVNFFLIKILLFQFLIQKISLKFFSVITNVHEVSFIIYKT
jgi:hypothetical protein